MVGKQSDMATVVGEFPARMMTCDVIMHKVYFFLITSGQVDNSKEIKRNISTRKYFSVGGNLPLLIVFLYSADTAESRT